MQTEGLAELVLLVYLPVLLLVLVALLWARTSRVPALAKTLKKSAVIWLVVLTVTFAAGVLSAITCQGNVLYGYHTCTLVSPGVAGATALIGVLSFAAAALYTAVLFAIGIVAEIIARNRQ